MSLDITDTIELTKIQTKLAGANVYLERIAAALESIEQMKRCEHLDNKKLCLHGKEMRCEGCWSKSEE